MIGPDDPAIALRCHDPAGKWLNISNEEILNHVLVLGATGAGKTSRVILPAFDDLCRGRNGLLVFDGKGDGSFRDAIRESTQRHGRTLIEVDGSGDMGFDLFGPLRSLGVDGAVSVAETLCCQLPVDARNRYWDVVFRRIVENALRILQLSNPEFDYEEAIEWLEDYLLAFSRMSTVTRSRVESLRNQLKTSEGDLKRQIASAIKGNEMWEDLDTRTRSNHQSMATALVGVLRSGIAKGFFDTKKCIEIADMMERNAVVFVHVDAFGELGFSRLLGNHLKAAFFRALMKRSDPKNSWGLISDDWTLTLSGGMESSSSEAAALPLIRSKRGFLIASCQSLAAVDALIGVRERQTALANFGSLLFLRGRDLESDLFAFRTFADPSIEKRDSMSVRNGEGRVDQTMSVVRQGGGSHAPMGRLSRLGTGEVMAAVCERVYDEPLFLSPYWEIRDLWGI